MSALATVGLLLSLAAQAPAEDAERGRRLFEVGKKFFETQRYDAAARAFQESYQAAPRAATIYSMAQCFRLLYREDQDPATLKRAVESYRRYLRDESRGTRRQDAEEHLARLEPILKRKEEEQRLLGKVIEAAPPPPTEFMITSGAPGAMAQVDGGEAMELPALVRVEVGPHKVRVEAPGYFPEEVQRAAVERRTVQVDVALRPAPARLQLVAPAGAQVHLDGRVVGQAPLATLELPAGRHLLAVTDGGHHPFQRELDLAAGEETRVGVELDGTHQRIVAWVFLAGAGALLAGGTLSGLGAAGAEKEARDIVAGRDAGQNLRVEDVERLDSLLSRRDQQAGAALGLLAGSLVIGTAGVLLYVFDEPHVSPPSTVQLLPAAGPGGAGATLRLTP